MTPTNDLNEIAMSIRHRVDVYLCNDSDPAAVDDACAAWLRARGKYDDDAAADQPPEEGANNASR